MRVGTALVVGLALLFGPTVSRAAGADLERISLPKGPGSIEGLGRSFTSSIASGTASYGIELELPPASGGFSPKLSLDYDGGQGASELGMGWKLGGIVRIRRRTDDGLPEFSSSDTFELIGLGPASELVEVSPGVYRPVEERGSFARVTHDAASGVWEVRDKAGNTYRLGGDGFQESEDGRVASYLLREELDLHGHSIVFEWDTSSGYGLLKSIVWNDFTPEARNSVQLGYEALPDPTVRYSSGIRQALDVRVSDVRVSHGDALVRHYSLRYGQVGSHSMLEGLLVTGSDDATAMPELAFNYTEPSFASAGQLTTMQAPPGHTLSDPNADLADLNGDGLPDLLVTKAGAFRSYVNHDGVSWLMGQDWSTSDSPSVTLGAPGVRLADVDGDGAIDLVAKSGLNDFRYFSGKDALSFAAPVTIASVPNFDFDDPNVQLADMDGDRRADAVISTLSGWAIAYNRGGSNWSEPTLVGVIDPKQLLMFSDGHTSLCDVNGDRVLDACYLTSGSLAFWIGRGRGAFEPASTGAGVPAFSAADPWQLRDLNGDGWVDLVHVGVSQVDYALASSPGHFDAPRTIGNVPENGPSTVVRFADMNASGTVDIVWVDVSGGSAHSWRYLELFPSGRSGLLRRIDNGLGGVTTIEYGTAAEDAAAARSNGKPWTTRINVALPVVRRIEIDSGVGDPEMVTEYVYRNGVYDRAGRTFAGFGGGEERARGDEFTPTLVTESHFDTGLTHHVMRGDVLSVETRDENGVVFARVKYDYQLVTLAKSLDGRPVEYAYQSSESKQEVEGAEASKIRETRTDRERDEWGNVVAERAWGEVVGGDVLAGDDERVTLSTYANDTSEWILGRVATQRVENGIGQRVSATRTYYDGPPFEGLPLGKVTRGDATRVEQWTGPADNDYVVQTATAYDADGNVIETRDARGGGRTYVWNPSDHTSLESESIQVGARTLTATVDTDPALGKPRKIVTFDGRTTELQYDPLGRITAIARPGSSLAAPTLAYEYLPSPPISRVITRAKKNDADDAERSETLFDGLGRVRGRMTRDGEGRWVLDDAPLLDARGNARKTPIARFVTEADHDSPPLLAEAVGTDEWRDATGRTIRARTPRGITTKTVYRPFSIESWDGAATDASSAYEHTPLVKVNDGLGRLVSVSQTLGGNVLTASYRYDAAGNLISKKDPEGHVSSFTYDGRGLRLSVDDPDAGKHVFAYDATGNLIEHHLPDGKVAKFTFDLAGRELTEDWEGDGEPEVEQSYDVDPSRPDDERYRGRTFQVIDPGGSTTYAYDERGNVAAVRRVIEGHTYQTETRYDAQDRPFLHVYPDGSSLAIHRNPRGLVSAYGDAVHISHDADGNETQRLFNTGVTELFGYDADRQLRATRVVGPTGAQIQDLQWTRDGAGNVISVKDSREGIDEQHDRSETYTYDNLNRLRTATGSWGKTEWEYSASGNLIRRESSLATQNAGDIGFGNGAGPHAMTQLMGRALLYDAFGRLTSDGVRKYGWDAASNLVSVKSASGASVRSIFGSSHERRVRVVRDERGKEHRTYFLSPWSEVRDGHLLRFIVHDGRRIARLGNDTGRPAATAAPLRPERHFPTSPWLVLVVLVCPLGIGMRSLSRVRTRAPLLVGATCLMFGCSGHSPDDSNPEGSILTLGANDTLLFYDGLGSLTEAVRATGEALSRTALYPYGTTRYDDSDATDKYTGAPRDTIVELDQMQARWYVPELGVWASVDPLNWRDPTKKVGMSFAVENAYAYAGGQPTTATDRSGECPVCIVVAAAALASGFAANAEYDREVKAGERTSPWKVAGVGVVAAEATALNAGLELEVFHGSFGAAFFAEGAKSASIGMAADGVNSLITGERVAQSHLAKSMLWDFAAGGFLGGVWGKAGRDWDMSGWTATQAARGKLGFNVTGAVLDQGVGRLKAVALPGPKPERSSEKLRSMVPSMITGSVSKSVTGSMSTSEFTDNMVSEVQRLATYR